MARTALWVSTRMVRERWVGLWVLVLQALVLTFQGVWLREAEKLAWCGFQPLVTSELPAAAAQPRQSPFRMRLLLLRPLRLCGSSGSRAAARVVQTFVLLRGCWPVPLMPRKAGAPRVDSSPSAHTAGAEIGLWSAVTSRQFPQAQFGDATSVNQRPLGTFRARLSRILLLVGLGGPMAEGLEAKLLLEVPQIPYPIHKRQASHFPRA
jgi:hypothetical protein